MGKAYFEWDKNKDVANYQKHHVSFFEARCKEERYYCFGSVGNRIMTVRFTYRDNVIRIIGAGFWRNGKEIYEEKNS
jgi:uncharacterized DUF497 family protein